MVGKVKDIHNKLCYVTREALTAGIQACVAGNRISDISHAVYDVAHTKNNFGVVYEYCGHGVGFDVHEDPNVPNCPSRGPNPRIKPGLVLAIEPMINEGVDEVDLEEGSDWNVITADGLYSCHEEHTVAVFPDHTEILTDLNYNGNACTY